MCYTIMKDDNSIETGDVEGYMAIGTSDYTIIILKISKDGQCNVLSAIENAHTLDITCILALSDYFTSLSFVTLSLDCCIKIYSPEGELEYECQAEGQLITGAVFPTKVKDYYVVSTQNEETEENMVGVYRR